MTPECRQWAVGKRRVPSLTFPHLLNIHRSQTPPRINPSSHPPWCSLPSKPLPGVSRDSRMERRWGWGDTPGCILWLRAGGG